MALSMVALACEAQRQTAGASSTPSAVVTPSLLIPVTATSAPSRDEPMHVSGDDVVGPQDSKRGLPAGLRRRAAPPLRAASKPNERETPPMIRDSRVTVHMAASLDGFIARKDGSVDWMETSDAFADGKAMDAAVVEALLQEIDCYVMGARTYETALGFEAKGLGWSYGDKPTFVLTHRELPRTRGSVELYTGDLSRLLHDRL